MKKFFVATLALTSLQAHALFGTQKNDRDIYDLMYLPKAGTIFGETSLVGTAAKLELVEDGEKIADIESTKSEIVQTIGYGISDRLTAGIQITHLNKSSIEIDYVDANTESDKFKANGLSDPTIGFKYRVVEQQSSNINLDLQVAYTIGTGTGKSATTTDDGDAKAGGSSVDIRAEVGNKLTQIQWFAFLGVLHEGDQKGKNATTGLKSTDKANSSSYIGGGVLAHFSESLVFGLEAEFRTNGKDKTTFDDGTHLDYSSNTSVALTPNITFLPGKNFSIGLHLTLMSVSDFEQKDEMNNKIDFEEGASAQALIKARYQF